VLARDYELEDHITAHKITPKMHSLKHLLRDRGKLMGGQKILSLKIHGYSGTCRFSGSTKDIFCECLISEQVLSPTLGMIWYCSTYGLGTQFVPKVGRCFLDS
jgi:hypothetical protein